MLWFNFILGLNSIFFCSEVCQCMTMSLKQGEIKFKRRTKLNYNIYVKDKYLNTNDTQCSGHLM